MCYLKEERMKEAATEERVRMWQCKMKVKEDPEEEKQQERRNTTSKEEKEHACKRQILLHSLCNHWITQSANSLPHC